MAIVDTSAKTIRRKAFAIEASIRFEHDVVVGHVLDFDKKTSVKSSVQTLNMSLPLVLPQVMRTYSSLSLHVAMSYSNEELTLPVACFSHFELNYQPASLEAMLPAESGRDPEDNSTIQLTSIDCPR
jgi:hypothetical protein